MTQAKVVIEVDTFEGITPTSVAARLAVPTAKPEDECIRLGNFFASLPQRQANVRVRVDSSLGVAAARTLTITAANIAAGEYIGFALGGNGTFKVSAVSSGGSAAAGTFNTGDTDNNTATAIRACINALPGLKDLVVASGSTNSVVVTARQVGIGPNLWRIVDGTGSPSGIGTAGLLTGGIDNSARATSAVAITNANLTGSTDTLTIGATVLTWVAGSPANENQVQIGANATASGDNLVTAINAHSQLRGLIVATNATGTVTLTYQCDPRAAIHCRLATNDATAMALTQPAAQTTLASVQTTRAYSLGRG